MWWTNSAFLASPEWKAALPSADLTFGSMYLADVGSYFRGADEYAASVHRALLRLRKSIKPSASKLIWQQPHAVWPLKTHADWNIVNNWQVQRAMRDALRRRLVPMSLRGPGGTPPPLQIFDPWAMTSSSDDFTGDGNHYYDFVDEQKLNFILQSFGC